jgi:bifunctional non-homologous end joining protein LigD
MPDRVEPALAVLKQRPPAEGYCWEIKWDGYRVHVHIEPNRVRVVTRGGFDWSHRFPAIVEAAKALGPATMILDGEAVMLDEQGRSDFSLLQSSLGATDRDSGNLISPAIMMSFDLIYLDGHDLRGMEYSVRQHLLEDTLQGQEGAIRLSEEIDVDPVELLDHACRLGLEGIVGKDRDSKYRPGRTGDWIKCKCVQSEPFLVVGYEPSILHAAVSRRCSWRPTTATSCDTWVASELDSKSDQRSICGLSWTSCPGGGNSRLSLTPASARWSGCSRQ